MIVLLLLSHALLAVALLGAITHQAISIWLPSRRASGSFVARVRSVPGGSYVNAVVVLYLLTAGLGAILYPSYRLGVRIVLQQLGFNTANGAFELKEHFVAVGLGILPAYWYFWRQSPAGHGRTRAVLTAVLAFIVWWGFVVGHILNNIRGFEL